MCVHEQLSIKFQPIMPGWVTVRLTQLLVAHESPLARVDPALLV
jgi:hypothetical protein